MPNTDPLRSVAELEASSIQATSLPQVEEPLARADGSSALRVLLLDDDDDLLGALKDVLCEAGYEVEAFGDAALAKRALAERSFDLAVTDLVLGKTGGLAFCEAVVRDYPRLPVIVLTGHADARSAALRLGARAVLIKPVPAEALVELLEKVAAEAGRSQASA